MMKNTWYVIIFVIAVMLLVFSWSTINDYMSDSNSDEGSTPTMEDQTGATADSEEIDANEDMADDEQPTTDDDTAAEITGDADTTTGEDTTNEDEGSAGEGTAGTTADLQGYVDYTESRLADALAAGREVALFFHAPWCPTCLAIEQSINRSPETIGSNQVIFKVDYDTETALKKQYDITAQSTIVYLDAEGEATNRTQSSFTVEEVVAGFEQKLE